MSRSFPNLSPDDTPAVLGAVLRHVRGASVK